ncbi:MAG TPA: N-acetylmuramoyl-L-alanine amidase [Coriobacteriia bacterium]|nr:N-acetylmuramoyl-L-alanine amidase [Coriobacteriia bacterium]
MCIDPGHQARGSLSGEPIGPGADDTKPKVTGGATGTVTGQPEHELVLAVSLLLAERLEAAGVEVVITRTTSNVDISNSERAERANDARADLFVRVHADGNTNNDISGVSTLYAAGNDWVEPIASESKIAATEIQRAVVGATKANDRGIVERGDLSGFNWSTVPAVLVECGFLSNPGEDRLLATNAYRAKLADGIAQGILAYLESH